MARFFSRVRLLYGLQSTVVQGQYGVRCQMRLFASQAVNIQSRPSLEPLTPPSASDEGIHSSSKAIDSLKHDDYFGVRDLFSLKDLYDARVHLGHKVGVRGEHMLPFIYGTRLGIDVIDLATTVELLREALNVTAHVAYRRGIILFVSRHMQTLPLVERTATECGEYSHCRAWKRGTFTNAAMMYGNETRMPDLTVFLSTHDTVFRQHLAVVETSKMNIMTAGIVDTSCDPRLICYPVPGNDDSVASISLYCRLFKHVILNAKERRRQDDHATGCDSSEHS